MAGAINFIKTCMKHEIKPILGMESYLCRDMHQKQVDGRRGNRHINLFAKNLEGYQNLCRLSQAASLEGFYHDNRIDLELLEKYSSQIICTSACLSNLVNWNLKIGRYEKAKKAASIFKDIFKDDYYLEIMYHGIEAEGRIIPGIQKLSKELKIKTLLTNDVHYPTKESAAYHDVVLCLSQNGKCLRNPKRLKFTSNEFYFKSTEKMREDFGRSFDQSMRNTMEVVEKCDLSDLKFGGMNLPKFEIPSEFKTPYDYLSHLAWEGFKKKGFVGKEKYEERLKLELSDIKLIYDTKGFNFDVYFFLVHDITRFIREKEIPYGVRGSGNSSLLLYCLNVSKVDPILYKLHWPRFLGFANLKFFQHSDFGMKLKND